MKMFLMVAWMAAMPEQTKAVTMKELAAAIRNDDLATVQQYVERDPALVNRRSESGLTPVRLAVYAGRERLVELFLSKGAALDVFDAAAAGRVETLRALLAHDAALANAYSADGYTALSLASFFGRDEAVRALLAAGSDVNAAARNKQKVTPLHGAVAGPKPEIAMLLLEAGADPNVLQEGDFTPLHEVAAKGNAAVAEALVRAGASVTVRSGLGKTPVDLAREHGHTALAEQLASHASPGKG
jgi:ankyrin repeat protein